jgi:hypothetical protein
MPWPEDSGVGYTVTMPNGEVLWINPATGEVQIVHPADPNAPPVSPLTPGKITDNVPKPQTPDPAGSTTGPSALGGTDPFLPSALKWLGALVLLWIILTALSEHGDPNAKNIGRALAGLILLGALFYLGPGAMSNVRNLWTQVGTPNPVQGPNPVPGA